MTTAAHKIDLSVWRARDLENIAKVRKALDALEYAVTGTGFDREGEQYFDFLTALYDLTEIDAVYDEAREIAPCSECGGSGEVLFDGYQTRRYTECGE
jgi:hypothetical protein